MRKIRIKSCGFVLFDISFDAVQYSPGVGSRKSMEDIGMRVERLSTIEGATKDKGNMRRE